jgi:nucleoside-diphosphate-sugar epimerase
MRVLILGVNGFIGSRLTWKILTATDWEVCGVDMSTSKRTHVIHHERFRFFEFPTSPC